MQAPAADHRAYRLANQEHAEGYAAALREAHDSFLAETPEGRRLASVREVAAEAEQLLTDARARATEAEANIRRAISAGRGPEPHEQDLRQARQDIDIYTVRGTAAAEALGMAELDARRALAERVEAVRTSWQQQARERFDRAAAELCAAAAGPALALVEAIAAAATANQPAAAGLLRLPG
jgi:hypothetical protein